MTPKDYFIDCHCHLFNIDDIPLYATAMTNIPSRTLIVLASLFGKLSKGELKKLKPFADFFERARRENLADQSVQIGVVRQRLQKKRTILTPLVMDFGRIPFSQEHSEAQTAALIDAMQGSDPS